MKLDVISTDATGTLWYEQGLEFTCSQCGNCCSGGPGYVWLSRQEVVRIAEFLRLAPEQVVERYCRTVDGRLSLREKRGPGGAFDCIFLEEPELQRPGAGTGERVVHRKRACSVYEVRPLQCRTWPFWPENLETQKAWNHAARKCHGMNAPGRKFTLKQIETIRDAAEWPANPPTSAPG